MTQTLLCHLLTKAVEIISTFFESIWQICDCVHALIMYLLLLRGAKLVNKSVPKILGTDCIRIVLHCKNAIIITIVITVL